jgi:hypothetical protein
MDRRDMLYSVEETAKKLDNLVADGDSFYFVRFGDGDLHLIAGHAHEQRHKNSPQLQRELAEALVIKDERYVLSDTAGSFNDGSGSYWWTPKNVQKAMDEELKGIRSYLRPGDIFYHALVFQYQIKYNPDWFISFCKNLFHDKKVLMIAGEPILSGNNLMKRVFNVTDEIAFPGLTGAYYHMDNRMEEILKAVEENDVILPVIGMASRVLAKRLWNAGVKKHLIDIGVSVDARACADHRGWTQKFLEAGGLKPYEEAF